MRRIVIRAAAMVGVGAVLSLLAGLWGRKHIGSGELLLVGIVGFIGILMSLAYSLRKHVWKRGNITIWLRCHEITAVAGTVLILWHTGLRVHNVTGWAALILLLILCVSGIVGRYLHFEMNRELAAQKKSGAEGDALLEIRWWRDRFSHWRAIHLPMTKLFVAVVLIHLLGTAFFGGWRI